MEDEVFVDRLIEELARLKEPKNMVAERIGYTAQTFTNITKGRNRPSVGLVYLLKQSYPDFDVNYLFTGVRSEEDTTEVMELRQELKRKNAMIDRIMGKSKAIPTSPGELYRMAATAESRKMLVRVRRIKPGYGQKSLFSRTNR